MSEGEKDREAPPTRERWQALLGRVARSPLELYARLDPDGRVGLLEELSGEARCFVLFKGSFDPIHHGHIALFAAARRKHAADGGAFALSFATAKRQLALSDVARRSWQIHAARLPVIVSRSGRFSHDAAFFHRLSHDLRLVFPLGTDVLRRLLEYYPPAEFAALFPGCFFEYFDRLGFPSDLPEEYGAVPNLDRLGENAFPAISSSQLRQLRARGLEPEVRALMPARAADLFLAVPIEAVGSPPAAPAKADPSPVGRWWSFVADREPPEIVRAAGVYLELRDGRRVLDAAGSAGVANIGHGRKEVIEAIARAATAVSYALPGFASPDRLALVERLRARWLPAGLSRVHLMNSGSEAIEAAIILARKYQFASGRLKRSKVIGRDLSYHGATLGSLAVGGHDGRRSGLGDLLPDQPHAAACYCLRCPFGKRYPDCRVECARSLERVIEAVGEENVAAFILEPIVGPSGGALVPPDDYWQTIHAICRRHGILVIADEVMTGWGRTGRRFACEHWGPPPDLLVSGKGLTGGYAPLAIVFTSEAVAEGLEAMGMKLPAHTYDGHSPGCAAANAVLQILEEERLVERVEALGPALGGYLTERLGGHPHVAEVRGRGFLWAVEVVRDRGTHERFPRHAEVTRSIVRAGLDRGVFFYPGGTGTERDIVVVSPPFTIAKADMRELAAVLESAIDRAVRDL